ncbi:CBS domain-containing protein [Hyperthermus butylicus]|nr:CBS domain-containing protein [Hyperthermus butylicus]
MLQGPRFYEIVEPHMPITKLVKLLAVKSIEHAIVIDDGIIIGVVSVKDVARHIVRAFEAAGSVEALNLNAILGDVVASIMSRPPYVVSGPLDYCRAASIMLSKGIGILPIVDSSGSFLGAITELDYALQSLKLDAQASRYATGKVILGDPDEPIIEALGRMYEHGFRRLPLRVGEDYYMATMQSLLLAIARRPHMETLLEKAYRYSTPATILDADTASIANAAETILSIPERAILLRSADKISILTERDLVRAYRDEHC